MMPYFLLLITVSIGALLALSIRRQRIGKIEHELRILTKDANENAMTLLSIEKTLLEISAHFSA